MKINWWDYLGVSLLLVLFMAIFIYFYCIYHDDKRVKYACLKNANKNINLCWSRNET